jgi:hypothetical protein
LSSDVKATGFKLDTDDNLYKPINGIGRQAKKLWTEDGGKDTYRLKLFTALSAMDTLIPCNMPVSIKLLLTSNERYYLTKTEAVLPKFVVHDAFMYFQVVLLKDLAFNKLNTALYAGNHFETRFRHTFGKTFTIDK